MKLYLEALETVATDSLIAPEFVRVDITGMAAEEEVAVTKAVSDLMAGRSYTLRHHHCLHDEGKACWVTP